MSEITKPPGKPAIQVSLDDEVITLSSRTLRSMMGMFAHLESLALSGEKNMRLRAARALGSKPLPVLLKRQSLEESDLCGTSFRELGGQVIRTARGQVRVLQARTAEIQSLVLINDWSVAERLWREILPDCKTPLFELNFLEELWRICPDQFQVNGWSLMQHWHQFVLIQAEVEIILARRQSLVELSDVLEGNLGLWLRRFGEILEKLDEESSG